MSLTDRLGSERIFHDRQAGRRAADLDAATLRFRDE